MLRVPLAGSTWSVLWTNDGRRYFHDALTNESVWEIPAELADNKEECSRLPLKQQHSICAIAIVANLESLQFEFTMGG